MINILGLGYIGLPTALMFAQSGIEVVGTDINEKLINDLNNGVLSIDEKGMPELFEKAQKNGITFTTKNVKTDTYIITVPTPYNDETKKINVDYVLSALNNILGVCENETIIVVESTISPGTIEKFVRPITDEFMKKNDKIIHLVHAPERIIPGNMVYELEHNSRTIGADNIDVANKVKDLYASFCKAEIVTTDIKSAEMSKVVENTFRDINIAFANELAKLCHEDGMDVYEIISIANKHPRVNILQPGPGVGGHCIPVDPWFLVGDYPKHTDLIRAAREVNSSMPEYVFNRIKEIMSENNILDFKDVGLYGLTYKENVDDIRESPTLQLLELMKNTVSDNMVVYDPFVTVKIHKNQKFNFEDFINATEFIVVLVGHEEIKNKFHKLKDKYVLDTKNIFNQNDIYKL